MHQTRLQVGAKQRRSGVAAVEFAVCLPVFVLLLLGLLETCAVIFLKQSLAISAYEGAHRAVKAGASNSAVQTACDQVLTDRRINGGTVQFVPADLTTVPKGQYFEIRVSAPTANNSLLASRIFRGMTMVSSAKMLKEG